VTTKLYPPRDITLPVTIFMDGIPFALCMTEKASLSAMHIRLSPWALYPSQINEVEFARKTTEGTERHRIPVTVDRMEGNLARATFGHLSPETLAALRQLLYEDEQALAAHSG
jgi:hypothetical protein